MTMAGDGNFKWYWADREDAERWHGDEDSRDAAVSAGRGEFGREAFWICEADKSVMSANFNAEFYSERIMDDLEESNEECLDEYGGGDLWPGNEAQDALTSGLEKLVEDWLKRFPAKTFTFGETRSLERIKALADA
jgi:hypothetical protein